MALVFAVDLDRPLAARPASTNNAYRNVPRLGRRLTRPAEAWKTTVLADARAAWLQLSEDERLRLHDAPAWEITLDYHVHRKGTQPDVSNLIKLAEDATVEAMGLTDKRIERVHCERHYCPKGEAQYLAITLRPLFRSHP